MTADELRAIVGRDAGWHQDADGQWWQGINRELEDIDEIAADRRALLALLREAREALDAYGDWRHHDDGLALALARLAALDPTGTPE